jgi:hypothetical protein
MCEILDISQPYKPTGPVTWIALLFFAVTIFTQHGKQNVGFEVPTAVL